MQHRHSVLALCGGIMAVMISATAVSFAQQVALGGDVLVNPSLTIRDPREATARAIYQNLSSSSAHSATRSSSASSATPVILKSQSAECAAVRAVLRQVAGIENDIMSDTLGQAAQRILFERTIREGVSAYCEDDMPADSSSSASMQSEGRAMGVRTINNHCNRYQVNSLETTNSFKCRFLESRGQRYP